VIYYQASKNTSKVQWTQATHNEQTYLNQMRKPYIPHHDWKGWDRCEPWDAPEDGSNDTGHDCSGPWWSQYTPSPRCPGWPRRLPADVQSDILPPYECNCLAETDDRPNGIRQFDSSNRHCVQVFRLTSEFCYMHVAEFKEF